MEMCGDDWCVDCSDDEKYEIDPKEDFSLKPEYLMNLSDRLECNNQGIELEWKCPGRRGPSPVPNNQVNHGLPEYNESSRIEEKDNFDFMDEMSAPRLPVRRTGEVTPKGSAKKKTASFNGVLSTMLRHRRQEQQEIHSSPNNNDPLSPKI